MPRPRLRSLSGAGQRPLSVALLALVLSLLLALSACAGDSEEDPAESGSSDNGTAEESPSVAEEPYLPVPDGVELTAQGSQLQVGDAAVVAYEPRQDQVGALRIKVTRLIDADFADFEGWKLTDETRKTNPYFVHATVKNVGDVDLGGQGVPLYAVDGNNKLIEASTFQSTFKPCSPEAFPERFRSGDKGNFCLVYLAPDRGDLTAVSFRPVEDFDPITWTGNLQKSGAGGKKGGDRQGGGNGGGGQNGDGGNGGGQNGGGQNGGGGNR
ncbi:MAG TPA: hypothetical protein VFY58_00255 [Nocardioides sp.]|nr:hypothetical protein [Nocardioides sp.]